MIAIDTNLLIYAHRSALKEHRAAQRAIEGAGSDARGWGIALASLAEFWSVVTHAESRGGPSTPQEARAFVGGLVEAGAQIWMPQAGFWTRLAQLAVDLDVRGARVFDLSIALTAFDGGATELWTHDRAFVTLPGLRVVDPIPR